MLLLEYQLAVWCSVIYSLVCVTSNRELSTLCLVLFIFYTLFSLVLSCSYKHRTQHSNAKTTATSLLVLLSASLLTSALASSYSRT